MFSYQTFCLCKVFALAIRNILFHILVAHEVWRYEIPGHRNIYASNENLNNKPKFSCWPCNDGRVWHKRHIVEARRMSSHETQITMYLGIQAVEMDSLQKAYHCDIHLSGREVLNSWNCSQTNTNYHRAMEFLARTAAGKDLTHLAYWPLLGSMKWRVCGIIDSIPANSPLLLTGLDAPLTP